jgi:hypothetical protein
MVGHTGSRGRAAKVAGRGIATASSPRASAYKSNATSPPQRRWGTVTRPLWATAERTEPEFGTGPGRVCRSPGMAHGKGSPMARTTALPSPSAVRLPWPARWSSHQWCPMACVIAAPSPGPRYQ